jgi:hypothetical protein
MAAAFLIHQKIRHLQYKKRFATPDFIFGYNKSAKQLPISWTHGFNADSITLRQ